MSDPNYNNQGGSNQDVEKYKGYAIIAYILFFIPLLIDGAKDSPFVRFHVNQGCLLFIAYAITIIIGWIPIIGWIIAPILGLATFIFFLIGVIRAAQGKTEPLPIIGNTTIIN